MGIIKKALLFRRNKNTNKYCRILKYSVPLQHEDYTKT